MLCHVVEVRIVEHSLGRNAANVQACASQCVLLLNTDGLHSELRCLDGGDVATRARTNDDNVRFYKKRKKPGICYSSYHEKHTSAQTEWKQTVAQAGEWRTGTALTSRPYLKQCPYIDQLLRFILYFSRYLLGGITPFPSNGCNTSNKFLISGRPLPVGLS